jgi:hypothetical protein
LSSGMEQQNQVKWRRDKVQELCSKGAQSERYHIRIDKGCRYASS